MNKETILKIANMNNGYLYSNIIKEHRIPTIYITRLVREGKLTKLHRGIYITDNAVEDIFFINSILYSNLVYSGDTALYLNNLSNRDYEQYEASIAYGKSLPRIENFIIKQSRKSTFYLGITEVETPFGNKVKCYDKERCICDLFIREDFDYEDKVYAINEYKRNYLNLKKLYDYAKQLDVYYEIKNVFEVIGWN